MTSHSACAKGAPADARTMLLSIHPRHVANIVLGSKTVELRRTRPAVLPGQPVLIYATAPQSALVATCTITRVETASPDELWDTHASAIGVKRGEYDAYLSGRSAAVALHLHDVRALSRPVPLPELRAHGPFYPPQTWHFLDAARETAMLRGSDLTGLAGSAPAPACAAPARYRATGHAEVREPEEDLAGWAEWVVRQAAALASGWTATWPFGWRAGRPSP